MWPSLRYSVPPTGAPSALSGIVLAREIYKVIDNFGKGKNFEVRSGQARNLGSRQNQVLNTELASRLRIRPMALGAKGRIDQQSPAVFGNDAALDLTVEILGFETPVLRF